MSTSGVQNEEQDIFTVQELVLIYAQSGLLYEIIPNASRSSFDPSSNLDHMPMELLVVRVPNLQIWL